MGLAKVMARGQVTLPRDVRRAARIQPGDVVNVEAIGPGRVQLTVLPRFGPRELRERYPIEAPVDEPVDRESWQTAAAADVLGKDHAGRTA